MREETIEQMSKQALTNGYMFKSLNFYNSDDQKRIVDNVSNMFRK